MKDSNRKSFWDFADKHPDIAYMIVFILAVVALGTAALFSNSL